MVSTKASHKTRIPVTNPKYSRSLKTGPSRRHKGTQSSLTIGHCSTRIGARQVIPVAQHARDSICAKKKGVINQATISPQSPHKVVPKSILFDQPQFKLVKEIGFLELDEHTRSEWIAFVLWTVLTSSNYSETRRVEAHDLPTLLQPGSTVPKGFTSVINRLIPSLQDRGLEANLIFYSLFYMTSHGNINLYLTSLIHRLPDHQPTEYCMKWLSDILAASLYIALDVLTEAAPIPSKYWQSIPGISLETGKTYVENILIARNMQTDIPATMFTHFIRSLVQMFPLQNVNNS